MKKHSVSVLVVALVWSVAGCVTHITTSVTKNPPPAEKFSAFNRFELTKVTLAPPYAGQSANEKALAKIQENLTQRMNPVSAKWNADGASKASARTLVIEPTIAEIKFIGGGARFWAGSLAGSSAVIMNVKISEKETGNVIATPMFYARAAAMAGEWTFGVTDNLMLQRIADRLADYLLGNYDAAIGGVTGAEPGSK